MVDVEQDHDDDHQHAVEEVEEDLVAHQVAGVALQVLDDAEDGPDQDQRRAREHHPHVALPGDVDGLRGRRRVPEHAAVEDPRHHDEDAERHQLHEQPADDDVLARLELVRRVGDGEHRAARRLHDDGDDVRRDEDLGRPLHRDDGVVVGLEQPRQPAEDHVDGSGHHGGRHEDHDGLEDVGSHRPLWRFSARDDAPYVTQSLEDTTQHERDEVPRPVPH